MCSNIVKMLLISFVVKYSLARDNCEIIPRLDIESHLATKTPYRIIANKDEKQHEFEGCEPVKIWAVIRHGTRNPGRKMITKVKDRLTKIKDQVINHGKSHLCLHEISEFVRWKFEVDEDTQKHLVFEGEDELLELAERMQKRFPTLFPEHYHPDFYKFKYTATQRTLRSAESFATGLFGRHKIKDIIYPEALHRDPILRFYKLCSRWKAEVDKNPDALEEVRKFSNGEDMHNVIKSIEQKTGLQGLTNSDVHLMYTTCAFEMAWYKNKISPWCYLFDRHGLKVMEFQEDLEYYWIDGYGYELTYQQACPAIVDMMQHINVNSSEANSTIYFTHSGTMLKLLAHLGLYKDDFKLTSKDFNKSRRWNVSKIDTFASNLVFVSYNCKNDQQKVLILHQEKVIHLPGCDQNEDLCDMATVAKILHNSIENCKFSEICKIHK